MLVYDPLKRISAEAGAVIASYVSALPDAAAIHVTCPQSAAAGDACV
jgi:hypothetical protein